MQILFTKFEPDWYEDFPNVFWFVEAIWGMEEGFPWSLHVLQFTWEDNNWGWFGW